MRWDTTTSSSTTPRNWNWSPPSIDGPGAPPGPRYPPPHEVCRGVGSDPCPPCAALPRAQEEPTMAEPVTAPGDDPYRTAELRRRVLAAWADAPTRFREDADAEEDFALGGYRDRVVVELAQNARSEEHT